MGSQSLRDETRTTRRADPEGSLEPFLHQIDEPVGQGH